jgi:hypothetical protein
LLRSACILSPIWQNAVKIPQLLRRITFTACRRERGLHFGGSARRYPLAYRCGIITSNIREKGLYPP